ncbi:hypothetical protein [Paenibacillus sp. BAC0078]
MIEKLVKKISEILESDARKSVALERSGATTMKVFFGSQALPKELR